MAKVVIYTTPWCPYCMQAKILLAQKDIAYEEVDVSADPVLRDQMSERAGRHTVPQIFINGAAIGGCDELYALERSGELERRIAEPAADAL